MKVIKNNTKLLIGIIIGVIITSSIGITIAYQINASQISYEDTNVASAITDLYTLSQTHCPDGSFCVLDVPIATGATIIPADAGDTFYAIVYLDPTNLSHSCNASSSTVGSGDTGCMKWYAYERYEYNGKTIYDLILDHNTSFGRYPVSKTQLENLTSRANKPWDNRLHTRMITGKEVANITGSTTWNRVDKSKQFFFDSKNSTTTATSSDKSKYYWLFDYLDCYNWGCLNDYDDPSVDSFAWGYWTSDYVCSSNDSNDSSCDELWHINRSGSLGVNNYLVTNAGLRPVITISK